MRKSASSSRCDARRQNVERRDCDAEARATKMEDVTTDENNRRILRRLKENDPDFDKLWVRKERRRGDASLS